MLNENKQPNDPDSVPPEPITRAAPMPARHVYSPKELEAKKHKVFVSCQAGSKRDNEILQSLEPKLKSFCELERTPKDDFKPAKYACFVIVVSNDLIASAQNRQELAAIWQYFGLATFLIVQVEKVDTGKASEAISWFKEHSNLSADQLAQIQSAVLSPEVPANAHPFVKVVSVEDVLTYDDSKLTGLVKPGGDQTE